MEEDGTSPYRCFWLGYGVRKNKRKLFIGLIPFVFLCNVIITQAGHIYCIYSTGNVLEFLEYIYEYLVSQIYGAYMKKQQLLNQIELTSRFLAEWSV